MHLIYCSYDLIAWIFPAPHIGIVHLIAPCVMKFIYLLTVFPISKAQQD